jgi:hypothetical protein
MPRLWWVRHSTATATDWSALLSQLRSPARVARADRPARRARGGRRQQLTLGQDRLDRVARPVAPRHVAVTPVASLPLSAARRRSGAPLPWPDMIEIPDFATHYHVPDKRPFLNLSDLPPDDHIRAVIDQPHAVSDLGPHVQERLRETVLTEEKLRTVFEQAGGRIARVGRS